MGNAEHILETFMSTFTDGKKAKSKRNDATIDIEETAQIRLQHSPYRAIRRITCEFGDGILVLQGRVATFHHKQLAQVAVADIVGVQTIRNNIEVESL